MITEENTKDLNERLERLERIAKSNQNENTKLFWMVMGISLLTLVRIRMVNDRVDNLREVKLTNRDYFNALATRQHQ